MEFLFSVKSSVPFCFCWETVWMMTLCTRVLGRANERLSFLKLEISVWRIYGEREVFKGEGKQCALSIGRVMGMRCWLCCGTIHRRCLVALPLPDSLTWRHARQLELKVLWPVELPVNTLYFLIQLSIMPRLYLNTQQAVCFVLYWFFPVILSFLFPSSSNKCLICECLKLCSFRSKPQGKPLNANCCFGRCSQDAVGRWWGSETGKEGNPPKVAWLLDTSGSCWGSVPQAIPWETVCSILRDVPLEART